MIDNTANTPDRIRRALAGADRELYRLGSTRVRRYTITAADLQGGDQTSQRIILDILPPGTQLRGQFIAIEQPFDSTDNQAVTARGYRTFSPVIESSVWVAATSAANIGPTNDPGTTIGGDEGFVCWGAPIVYALTITGTDLQALTKGKITVSLVLAPLREVADDDDFNRTTIGPADGAASPSVLTTGVSGGGGGPSPTTLSDLTDVYFYGLAVGDVLTWNGTTWGNQDPLLAGVIKTWDYGDSTAAIGFEIDFRDSRSTLVGSFGFGDSVSAVEA